MFDKIDNMMTHILINIKEKYCHLALLVLNKQQYLCFNRFMLFFFIFIKLIIYVMLLEIVVCVV